jgi:hypothetical protein
VPPRAPVSPPAPARAATPGRPSIEIDVEATPAAALYPGTPGGARGAAAAPAARPTPESTLRTSRNEAEELRRRIATPGIPDEEIDLEEIHDGESAASSGGRLVLAPESAVEPPDAVMQPEPEGASEAEVEVPIEIEVAPGTTRVSLTLKLVLFLKR